MPENIRINEEDGIVEIVSFGIVSKEDIESSLAKAKQIRDESGINKILLDTTMQVSMPGTMSIYKLFSDFPRDLRTALLANQEQNTLKDIQFSETVARNQSAQVKIFFLRWAALEWLQK